MAQSAEIKRLGREWERRRKEDLEDDAREDDEARERAVREFEKVQAGLRSSNGVAKDELSENKRPSTKRKFELDEEELMRIAKEERTKMRKEMDDEKKAGAKHLPSFWAPSQTPDGSAAKVSLPEKAPKLNPLCPSSSESSPHTLTLKTLTPIKFTEEKSSQTGKTARSCPACRKALTNISKGVLAIPCGHVLCKSCVDKFMQPIMTPDPHNPGAEHGVLRCYVCETNLMNDEEDHKKQEDQLNGVETKKSKKKKDKDKDTVKRGLVELKSDGTGFAGGGKNTVEKKGVAFQC